MNHGFLTSRRGSGRLAGPALASEDSDLRSVRPVFRLIRITILVLILINVAVGTWLTRVRSTSWEHPLRVMMFPINADGSAATADYIAGLRKDAFQPIAAFVHREAQRYGVSTYAPVDVYLGAEISAGRPTRRSAAARSQIVLWSLRMRLWAWRNAQFAGPAPDVRVFVLYHDPEQTTRVAHSLGLQKGLIGVVNAFASKEQQEQNNVVIAHELLHTVGATDKYDTGSASNLPAYSRTVTPSPTRIPLLPQDYAEIMGGRIPAVAARGGDAGQPRSGGGRRDDRSRDQLAEVAPTFASSTRRQARRWPLSCAALASRRPQRP